METNERMQEILKRLDAMFPNKQMLTKGDVVLYTGLTYPTVRSKFNWSGRTVIDKVVIASELAKGAK